MALISPTWPNTGTSSIRDDSALRDKAREAVQAGRFPNRRPDRMWAGRSAGAECAICGAPVDREEMEYELEYARNGPGSGVDSHHVHIRCFAACLANAQDPGGRQVPSC